MLILNLLLLFVYYLYTVAAECIFLDKEGKHTHKVSHLTVFCQLLIVCFPNMTNTEVHIDGLVYTVEDRGHVVDDDLIPLGKFRKVNGITASAAGEGRFGKTKFPVLERSAFLEVCIEVGWYDYPELRGFVGLVSARDGSGVFVEPVGHQFDEVLEIGDGDDG